MRHLDIAELAILILVVCLGVSMLLVAAGIANLFMTFGG